MRSGEALLFERPAYSDYCILNYEDCTWLIQSNDSNDRYILTILRKWADGIALFQIGEGLIADSQSRIIDALTAKPEDWFIIGADMIWIRVLYTSCGGVMNFKLETSLNGTFNKTLYVKGITLLLI